MNGKLYYFHNSHTTAELKTADIIPFSAGIIHTCDYYSYQRDIVRPTKNSRQSTNREIDTTWDLGMAQSPDTATFAVAASTPMLSTPDKWEAPPVQQLHHQSQTPSHVALAIPKKAGATTNNRHGTNREMSLKWG